MTDLSNLLLAAADRIRDLAAHYAEGDLEGDRREAWLYWSLDRNCDRRARAWIAAVSPVVAGPFEELLREYARCATDLAYQVDKTPDGQAVLALARAVMADTPG